jgi:hypothetical protein
MILDLSSLCGNKNFISFPRKEVNSYEALRSPYALVSLLGISWEKVDFPSKNNLAFILGTVDEKVNHVRL